MRDTDTRIQLSSYQQNCLADIAQCASSISWAFKSGKTPTLAQWEEFQDIILKYEKINWGTIYDIMHRQGSNF